MSKEKEYCRRLSVQGVGVYEELLVLCREVSLPWCGVLYEGCTGLLYNGGLYTQCGVKSEGKYCVGCMGIKESGKWKGDVSDRMKCKIGEYSVGGKKEISYMKWLSKKGVSREMAEREASSRGISIPLVHFEGGILKEKEAGCRVNCRAGCRVGCRASCRASCRVDCRVGCRASCRVGCRVGCSASCRAGCSASCRGNCRGSCRVVCRAGCRGNCRASCRVVCRAGCRGNCRASKEKERSSS